MCGEAMSARLEHGDCIEVMAAMDAGSVDAIVCDPPYHLTNRVPDVKKCRDCGRVLGGSDGKPDRCPRCNGELFNQRSQASGGFMGKDWDGGAISFDPATWEACLRVLKPGGYLLAFGGTRTFYRMAVAIEDAGFRLQDTLSWLHGQGFPKGKAQLKPGWEPIIMARKPGSSVLNIDDCRIEAIGGLASGGNCIGSSPNPMNRSAGIREDRERSPEHPSGRWPANVVLDEDAAALLDAMSGERGGGKFAQSGKRALRENPVYGKPNTTRNAPDNYGDTGGASRFFYVAKASRAERNAGLEGMPERVYGLHDDDGHRKPGERKNNHTAPMPAANHHPTVKPIALMRWLVRLVTPPNGLVLDPFAGSGTTGCAAALEGFRFVGIEQDAEYVEIARQRIAHWTPKPLPQPVLPLAVTP